MIRYAVIFGLLSLCANAQIQQVDRLSCLNGIEYGIWGDRIKNQINFTQCAGNTQCVRVEAKGSVIKGSGAVKVREVRVWGCMPSSQCEDLECSDELLHDVKTAVQSENNLRNFTYDKETCKSLCCDTNKCNAKSIHSIKRGATLCLTGTQFRYNGTTHQRMKGTGVCYNQKCFRAEAHGTVEKVIGDERVTLNVSDIQVYGCSGNCGNHHKLVCDWNTVKDIESQLLKHDPALENFSVKGNCRSECCRGDDCNNEPLSPGGSLTNSPGKLIFFTILWFYFTFLF